MKISYDLKADTITIRFCDTPGIIKEWAEGIVGEYDAQGKLLAIKVPDFRKHFGKTAPFQEVVLEGLGPPVAQGRPPSTIVANHIVLDERGVAWIDDTNVKVIEVVLEYVAYKWSAEAMHIQHPDLSLSQIHAALSYYLDHQAEFDREIARQEKEYELLRTAQGGDTPLSRRLRSAGKLP